jgi:curved DNA-binding protein CbpA
MRKEGLQKNFVPEMSTVDPSRLKVSELKAILRERNVAFEGAVERQDLLDLVMQSGGLPGTASKAGAGRKERKASGIPSADRQRQDEKGEAAYLRLVAAADVLKISVDAADDVVKAAHTRLAKEHHPDRVGADDRERATALFIEAQAAFELIVSVPHKARAHAMRTAKRKLAARQQATAAAGLSSGTELSSPDDVPETWPELVSASDAEQQASTAHRHRRAPPPQQQDQAPRRAQDGGTPRRGPSPVAGTPRRNPQQFRRDSSEIPQRDSAGTPRRNPQQFQDILAEAARESTRAARPKSAQAMAQGPVPQEMESRAGPTDTGENRRGDGFDDGLGPCIEVFTCFAFGYILCQDGLNRCTKCVCTCGGLLDISEEELRSWGYRVEEHQIARYRHEPQLPRDGAAAHRAQVRRAARSHTQEFEQQQYAASGIKSPAGMHRV